MKGDYINWIIVAIYMAGIAVTYFIIQYHDKEEKEEASVNIASVLWPVTWAIYLVLVIEKGLKCLWKMFSDFLT